MKQLINFWRLWRVAGLLKQCDSIIRDPRSNYAKKVGDELTLEEMDGVFDMHRLHKITTMKGAELKKDLKHLKKRLDISA